MMDKAYIVDFLSCLKPVRSRLSALESIEGLDMSKYLEALILERSDEGYELVSVETHREIHSTYGLIPTGYLITFKEKN